VVNHDDAIARDTDVELERVDADCECALETGERVLRRMPARPTVPLEIERRRRLRDESHGEREPGYRTTWV
jgi:hypothetical protein